MQKDQVSLSDPFPKAREYESTGLHSINVTMSVPYCGSNSQTFIYSSPGTVRVAYDHRCVMCHYEEGLFWTVGLCLSPS